MAIDTWITVTVSTGTGVNPKGTAAFAGADGGNVTVAYDSAAITTHSQLRDGMRLASSAALSRLTGP